jgi:hypothetical protein
VCSSRKGFLACGSVEATVYVRCAGGKAARTTEKDCHFHAAAGQKAKQDVMMNAPAVPAHSS